MQAFTDLATATYCPRKLYYKRDRDGHVQPDEIASIRNLAYRYESILDGRTALGTEPIATAPQNYRSTLESAKERLDRWDALVRPDETRIFVEGKDAHGIVHKLLADPIRPVIVSPGEPPEEGVWKPHSVWATAAAKAVSWEQSEPIERAYLEYPAYGIIRPVRLTTRRKAAYRKALRIANGLDGAPPRLRNDSRCGSCEYSDECGTRTRSLRSRLSL